MLGPVSLFLTLAMLVILVHRDSEDEHECVHEGMIDPAFRNGPALAGILKQAHHKHDEQPVYPEEEDQAHDAEFDIEVKLVL